MSYRSSANIARLVLYLLIVVLGLAFVFPFFWMIISSVKMNKDVLAIPVRFFPVEWNWKSYVNVFTAFPDFNFPRFIFGTWIFGNGNSVP